MERNAEREIRMSGEGLDRRFDASPSGDFPDLKAAIGSCRGDGAAICAECQTVDPVFSRITKHERIDEPKPFTIAPLPVTHLRFARLKESFVLLNVGRLGCQFRVSRR